MFSVLGYSPMWWRNNNVFIGKLKFRPVTCISHQYRLVAVLPHCLCVSNNFSPGKNDRITYNGIYGEFFERPLKFYMKPCLNKYDSLNGNNERLEKEKDCLKFFLNLVFGGYTQMFWMANQLAFEYFLCFHTKSFLRGSRKPISYNNMILFLFPITFNFINTNFPVW